MASVNHLITPPSSTEISHCTKAEEVHCEKVDLNNYVKNASLLIISLWKSPVLNDTNTNTNATSSSSSLSLSSTAVIPSAEFLVFLKEILKRSRCSLTVLQIAMFYLFKLQKKIKNRVVDHTSHLCCPKKVFLLCLILAFKYSLDSNYKFATWSKISGLAVKELQSYEMKLLADLNYGLNDVNKPGIFNMWVQYLASQPVAVVPVPGRERDQEETAPIQRALKRARVH